MLSHRDFIWQCDYGDRQPVVEVLEELLDTQNENQLGMCTLFVNNNIYQLEFFIVLGYEVPEQSQIEVMKDKLTSVGARLRTDITFRQMIELMLRKRFDSIEVPNSDEMENCLRTVFQFHDRKFVASRIPMGPLGSDLPIFLSHSSKDKPFVEELIPYLNRHGLAVWYDKINISYGESIVKAVMNGVDDSGAVIFFITKNFLASKWCEEEMESFLSRVSEGDKILPISVVFPDVEHKDLPRFIRNKKYLRLDKELLPSLVASELIPAFREFFKL
ncbi:toll/interleukin-1 receptor domain-containing protein [Photobacterium chitinilyticum]|uniref:toll/interleukin-1 receptor domain-containing protein n=1 Tax=Photobacterium chitinilyticum TaxID=2485123 RepID=UPI003D0A642B